MCHYCIKHNTLSVCNMISVEMYLFAVCWSQGQIIQAVRGHVPNSIEEPGVSDHLHTQLPGQEVWRKHYYTNCFHKYTGFYSCSEWLVASLYQCNQYLVGLVSSWSVPTQSRVEPKDKGPPSSSDKWARSHPCSVVTTESNKYRYRGVRMISTLILKTFPL